MSHNSFGHLFRVTTFGESHGPAIGCVVDGCPPGLALHEALIQADLDRRRPGGNAFVSQRQEADKARILSGVFEGRTTGTPIAILIENTDQRPKDYAEIVDAYRPGHADYTYDAKYGLRDHRGGGRASARETASRVAAGAIARLVLGPAIQVRAALIAMGGDRIDDAAWDWAQTGLNPFFCPDAQAAERWAMRLDAARKAGSSLGGIVAVSAQGVPAGWGAPIYGKLDGEIAAALMGINAVKGVEIGAGFAAAAFSGEVNADEMRAGPDGPVFLSNQAGGVLGGISTGQDIIARMAVKPTSSILTPRRTITRDGRDTDIRTKGRHDPCVAIRAVPVAEAMLACVLADAKLRHRGQIG